MFSFTLKGAPGQMVNYLISLDSPTFWVRKTGAENRKNLDANMHLWHQALMFSITPLGLF